jgi:hypothetical protein
MRTFLEWAWIPLTYMAFLLLFSAVGLGPLFVGLTLLLMFASSGMD